jgi:hypothetical protein
LSSALGEDERHNYRLLLAAGRFRLLNKEGTSCMRLTAKIKEAGATGYILLWLLGIPIPILLLIFLLRGCT